MNKQDWTYKKLGEVAKISSGKSIPATEIEECYSDGLYPCYGGNGLRGYVNHYSYDGLYPIIGRVGALCGNVHLTNGKFYATEHALVVSLKIDINPKYTEYSLKSLGLRQFAKGVAQPVLSASTISEIPIPVPPLAEQERIVAELDLLSGIIEKKKEQLKAYDQLAQSIFYSMFGDPVDNPKGWEVKKLGEVCNSELGKTLNQAKDTGTLRPYLCAINIQWNRIVTDNLKQPRFEDSELERYTVKKGDLLVCEGGDIGRAAIWAENDCIQYQNALHRLRFNGDMIPIFCLNVLKFLKDKGVLDNRYGKGVTIKHLVKSALLSIPFIIPPLSLQQEFAEKIEAIERQKALVQQSIEETQTMFDYTMDKYFG